MSVHCDAIRNQAVFRTTVREKSRVCIMRAMVRVKRGDSLEGFICYADCWFAKLAGHLTPDKQLLVSNAACKRRFVRLSTKRLCGQNRLGKAQLAISEMLAMSVDLDELPALTDFILVVSST